MLRCRVDTLIVPCATSSLPTVPVHAVLEHYNTL